MTEEKRYQIIDGPLSIRFTANGRRTGSTVSTGEQIRSSTAPVIEGNYIWIHHALGWSAMGTVDKSEMYMLDITDRDPNVKRRFRVGTAVLSIRDAANGARIAKKLYRNAEIEVEPNSRTELGGYVWWKHADGWSAERNQLANQIYLKEIFDTPETIPVIEPKKTTIPNTWTGIKTLQVVINVKVRGQPNTNPRGLVIRTIPRGEVLECNMDTLVEADGYYWVRHRQGWSAIQSTNGQTVFLVEPGSIAGLIAIGADGPKAEDLPNYRALFTRLPVNLDDIQWFQYFGNNMFAMRNGKNFGYDRYSQGLHGGLDFGNSIRPKPVYAGLDAEFVRIEYPSRNNTRMVLKKDDYTIIYQHLANPRHFNEGDVISPDTQIGIIEHHSINNGWDHLHLEVRFMKLWIVNPLLLLTEDLYDSLTARFNPLKPNSGYKRDFPKSMSNFFYFTESWTKWVTPLDQPMIKLAGDVIGPRGELDKADW
ncbi:MAG: hypothetical protein Phog2KO_23030 [Phototrophicaceae bacterium]